MTDENYIILNDISNWNDIYDSDKYLILYFTASWCGPCRKIEPFLKQLSNEYKSIYIIKIDVDNEETMDITYSMKISCMPTFIFIQNKKIFYSLEGANGEKLYNLINTFNEDLKLKNKEKENADENYNQKKEDSKE